MNPQTHIKPTTTQSIPEALTEKRLQTSMTTRKNDTLYLYVALDDVTLCEAAELDAIALLADSGNDDFDLKLRTIGTSECACLPFFREGQRKSKGKGKGRYPVRPPHLSLEDRQRRLKELKAKTECDVCGRQGTLGKRSRTRNVFLHLVYSKSDTYSSYSDTTTTYHPNESGWSVFVLNEYSDDPDTFAYVVGLNIILPTETTEQILLTPTSAAVDTKDRATFKVRVMDDNDEIQCWPSRLPAVFF